MSRLITLGLVVKATDGRTMFCTWTPFGYAVIGKLGAKLG
jgi:hypothetical protein